MMLRLLVVGGVWVGVYIAQCALWPYTRCRHCQGGRRPSPSGRAFGQCWWCKGTGSRTRWGRRIFGVGEG